MSETAAGLEFPVPIAAGTTNLSLNSLYKTYKEGALELRPAFQRNLVWNVEQQSYLVDSVLRGLPVPEIYVQTKTSLDGDEHTIVVDGQQRITTCIHFMQGFFRLTSDPDFDSRWRGRTFSELDDDLQLRFREFKLVARTLPSLNPTALREIFRRLNKTVEPLEPQELRHAAYTGPLISLVEQAAARPELQELGVFSARDYLRRRSDELVSEICLALATSAFPNKKEGLDNLFLTYERQGTPDEKIKSLERRIGRVLAQLSSAAGPLRRTRFRNKSDFYSLFIYLAKHAERLPLEDLDARYLVEALKVFSDQVNDLKRDEAKTNLASAPQQYPDGVTTYLRAVERAASDRLNRVRREATLADVLGPVLAAAQPRELTDEDGAWRYESLTLDVEEESDSDTEREATMQALLAGGPELD